MRVKDQALAQARGWAISARMRQSTLLSSAFAAFLLLIGASGLAIWRSAATAQDRVQALLQVQFETASALASIRADVYFVGILTRDYLLDIDPDRNQLMAARTRIADSFRLLLRSGEEDENQRPTLERLRREMDTYWGWTESVLDWTSGERAARRAEFLAERTRQREEIVHLTSQLERLIAEDFFREHARIITANRQFQTSLAMIGGTALLLGLGIAMVTLTRMRALERHQELSESELRQLSTRVLTAQEDERKNLSRELHDQVGQMLTGLQMQLSNVAHLHGSPEGELAERVAQAKKTVEQTLGVVRNMAMLLRPPMLDDLGLAPALTWLAKDMSKSTGMKIDVDVDPGLDSLPEMHRTCLYRVVQESLSNAARHARATAAHVSIARKGESATGVISDDGVGIDNSRNGRSGLGLVGMRERVGELGGTIEIASSHRRGTRVELCLPIPKNGRTQEKAKTERQ